jgi:hypothetical protein
MPASLVLQGAEVVFRGNAPAVNLDGQGEGSIGAVRLDQSGGTVEVNGVPRPAAFVARSQFEAGPVLHELYVLGPDRFYLLWSYCYSGSIRFLYVEDSEGEIHGFELATGTCAEVRRTSDTSVTFPRTEIQWPKPLGGYAVSGHSLRLDPGVPGAVWFDGTVQSVITFATIDCRNCAEPGWFELHSLLWDPRNGAVTVGIFYLELQAPGAVRLLYAVHLSSMSLDTGSFTATWRIGD